MALPSKSSTRKAVRCGQAGCAAFRCCLVWGPALRTRRRARLLPLTARLLVLGASLTCYYWRHVAETDAEGYPNVGLMVPICNVLAYLLGPIALTEPPWMAIGVTVVAVLLLTTREKLHGLARRSRSARSSRPASS